MTTNNPCAPAVPAINTAIRRALKSDAAAAPQSVRSGPKPGSRAMTPERRAEARRIAAEEAGGILRGGGLLRPRHLAALLGVSHSTLWAMVRDGRLPPPSHLGERCTVWRAGDIRALLAGLEVQP